MEVQVAISVRSPRPSAGRSMLPGHFWARIRRSLRTF